MSNDLLDETLLSGFISAIMSFGREIDLGGDVERLILSGQIMYYSRQSEVVFVALASKEVPELVIQFILGKISQRFLNRYKNVVKLSDGNVSIFNDFKEELRKYLEEPLLEKILEDFGYRLHAEGVILYDAKQDEILYSRLPAEIGSRRHRALGGMLISFAKKVSDQMNGGEVNSIIISTERKWICTAKKEEIHITALFPKKKEMELELLSVKTEEILEEILGLLN